MIKQRTPVVVAAAGTAVPLAATRVEVSMFILQASPLNDENIYYGDADVDDTNGIALAPGESMLFPQKQTDYNLGTIYIDADTNDNSARIAVIRD